MRSKPWGSAPISTGDACGGGELEPLGRRCFRVGQRDVVVVIRRREARVIERVEPHLCAARQPREADLPGRVGLGQDVRASISERLNHILADSQLD